MSAKERHKKKVVLRLANKLESLQEQESQLHDVIRGFVAKAETETHHLLETDDSSSFLQQYGRVEQFLDRVNNVCELLAATAEDMIENTEEEGTAHIDETIVSMVAERPMVTQHCVVPKPKDEQIKQELTGILEKARRSQAGSPVEGVQAVVIETPVMKQRPEKSQRQDSGAQRGRDILLPNKASVNSPDEGTSIGGGENRDMGTKNKLRMPHADSLKVNKTSGAKTTGTKKQQENFNRNIPTASSPRRKEKKVEQTNDHSNKQADKSAVITKTGKVLTDETMEKCAINERLPEKEWIDTKLVGESTNSKAATKPKLTSGEPSCNGSSVVTENGECEQSCNGSCDRTEKGDYSAFGLYMTPVMVTEVVSPWCFFVQQQGTTMTELMDAICIYIQTEGFTKKPPTDISVGSVCLARYSDDRAFYRAYVRKVYSSPAGVTDVDVLYVDYGNQEKVHIQSVRAMPEQFRSLPFQSVCCALAEVMPNNKYHLWTDEGILRFRQCISGQLLICTQVGEPDSHSQGLPCLVQLTGNFPMSSIVSGLSMNQLHIGQLLVSTGQAKYVTLAEQAGLLRTSAEGLEESEILNKGLGKQGSKVDNEVTQGNAAGGSPKTVKKDSVKCIKLDVVKQVHTEKVENKETVQNELETVIEDVKKSTPAETVNQCKADEVISQEPKDLCAVSADVDVEVDREVPKEAHIKDNPPASVESGTTSNTKEASTDTTQSSEMSSETNPKPIDLDFVPQASEGQEVMLASVKSPSHFFVHLVTNQVGETLNLLMKNLNKQFERMNRRKLSKLSQDFVPAVGKLCCARFKEDNQFYRAKILSCEEPAKDVSHTCNVHVHYIDYGDDEWAPRSRLLSLPPEFTCIPPLAIQCRLAYVKPKGNIDTWQETSTEMLIKMAGFEKTLQMHVVHGKLPQLAKSESTDDHFPKWKDRDPLGILLLDRSGSEEVCFNVELINLGAAILDPGHSSKHEGNTTNKGQGSNHDGGALLDNWNPMEQEFFSNRNSYNIDVDDVGVATVGYKYDDDKTVCKFYSRGLRCWRGESCPFKHIKTDSGVRMDEDEVYAVGGNQDIMPSVNSWVAVEVTTILSPSHFYIHLPMGNKSLDTTQDSGTGEETGPQETLDDLHKAINESYDYRSLREGKLTLRAPGEIVAARFTQDEQWYRARVVETTEEKIRVFFLDYGNTEWLRDRDLADIKPEFLHLPFQALECFLCNVEPSGAESWTQEARAYFRQLVDGKTLVGYTRFLSWNGILWVDLYDTSEKYDVNIGARLVEQEYALKSAFPSDTTCNTSDSGSSRRSSVVSEINYIPG